MTEHLYVHNMHHIKVVFAFLCWACRMRLELIWRNPVLSWASVDVIHQNSVQGHEKKLWLIRDVCVCVYMCVYVCV